MLRTYFYRKLNLPNLLIKVVGKVLVIAHANTVLYSFMLVVNELFGKSLGYLTKEVQS